MTNPRALHYEIEYYEYDCWKPCTPNGCMGHTTDVPVALHFDDVSLYVEGFEQGDFPAGADNDEVRKVQNAIGRIINAIDLAAVTGGDACAEARADGRGPCGACSWCVKQAQDRAEKAERELKEAKDNLLRAIDMLDGGFCAAYLEHIRSISFGEYLQERDKRCPHCIKAELFRYQGLQATNETALDIAVRLFEAEAITQGEGATIARLSRCEFINQLLARGISPIQVDE